MTDFDEFSALVTAPLARLKIKKLVRDIENNGLPSLLEGVSVYISVSQRVVTKLIEWSKVHDN